MKQVTFRCRTCEERNSENRGMPGFQEIQTEFESLTDAWLHIQDRDRDYPLGPPHDLIAVIEDDI